MPELVNDKMCPFCQRDNQCGVDNALNCWCREVIIPQGLADLLAIERPSIKSSSIKYKDKACICSTCVNAYNDNPQLFQQKWTCS